MSVFGVLARADNNNKGAIPYDHGVGLYPQGKYILNPYQSVGRIKEITRFGTKTAGGTLCVCEIQKDLFPPQTPAPFGAFSSATGRQDVITIDGVPGFEGEFSVLSLDGTPSNPRRFLYLDRINPANTSVDAETFLDQGSLYFAPLSIGDTEILMDPQRVISHPSFPQREGEGRYTYPFRPDILRNFIYHPATKVDGQVTRTVSSSVLVAQPQVDEDVVVSEIWLGGSRQLSTLSEMFRVLYLYWTTLPEPGQVLGWEPRDRCFDRFGIQIVRVSLGGADYEYEEVREIVDRSEGSYLNTQLTLQFKLAKRVVPPRPMITMEGL